MRVSAPLGAVCPPNRNPQTYPYKPIKEDGCVGSYSSLIPSGYVGRAPLDSSFRGNDGSN